MYGMRGLSLCCFECLSINDCTEHSCITPRIFVFPPLMNLRQQWYWVLFGRFMFGKASSTKMERPLTPLNCSAYLVLEEPHMQDCLKVLIYLAYPGRYLRNLNRYYASQCKRQILFWPRVWHYSFKALHNLLLRCFNIPSLPSSL